MRETADVLEAVESALSDNRIDHAEALAQGQTPGLIEIGDDLSPDFAREKLVIVDHHGAGRSVFRLERFCCAK